MERWSGRVALVTGASAGIGAAVVRALVSGGMKVVGCARRVERVQALKDELKNQPGSVFPIQCDLSQEDQILAMFEKIRTDPNLGGVDVCVNNAGLSKNAPLLSGETSQWRSMLDVNVLALSICTREAVNSMRARGVDDGYLFLIGSLAGHKVLNRSAIHFYSATKFAVRALTEGIRNELREMNSHIRVTAISPGVVETEFSYQMYSDTPEKAKAFYASLYSLRADDIASQLVFALQSPPHVQVHDIIIRPIEQLQ